MIYTPDRELTPPEGYYDETEYIECFVCEVEVTIDMVEEVERFKEYGVICDDCMEGLEDMTDDEVDEYINEVLEDKGLHRCM